MKRELKGVVVQNTLVYILKKYAHTRPIWQFGRGIDDSKDDWMTKLFEDFYFRQD